MIILSKVLKESNQIKILAIRVAAKRTLDNALLLIREFIKTCDKYSEDIDIAISEAWTLSGNQLKMLIKRTAKNMTEGLQETNMPGFTSKGSHYHKAYYSYPQAIATAQVGAIKAGQLLVEINSFANPYPFQKCKLQSFLTEFLQKTDNGRLIEEYDMQPFEVNVLDRRRTLTEKLVSLLRCSLADNYILELTAKIRHFYDLHFLLNDDETRIYLESDAFKSDFTNLFAQDQQRFDKPEGWQNKDIIDSPIINNLHNIWSTLSNVYSRELPDLAYKEIPTIESIENSMKQLFSYLT